MLYLDARAVGVYVCEFIPYTAPKAPVGLGGAVFEHFA